MRKAGDFLTFAQQKAGCPRAVGHQRLEIRRKRGDIQTFAAQKSGSPLAQVRRQANQLSTGLRDCDGLCSMAHATAYRSRAFWLMRSGGGLGHRYAPDLFRATSVSIKSRTG